VGIGLSCIFWSPSVLPLYSGFVLFLVTQLTSLGGCIGFVGPGCGRILAGVRKVLQSRPISLLLPHNQAKGGFVGGGLRGAFVGPEYFQQILWPSTFCAI